MKLLLTLIALITFCGLSNAAEKLPDFTKVFPDEKLMQTMKLENIETYSYLTNSDFDILAKTFSEFLGDKWAADDFDISENPELAKQIKDVDVMTFSNPAYPEISIGLARMKMEIEGKKFLISISVTKTSL
ncbi:MAG: hypothetical protein ACSHX0_13115 [Akkermansiaceae bacterium]